MLDSFLTFINQHAPALKRERTLLAVSGGIDSVVMADLFHKLGLQAGIAHCNFGLRGEESEGDEQFVRELAGSYGFPLFTKRFDVKSFAKLRGSSTQMAARELRYEWFEAVRAENNYTFIATAHHANDSIETTLLNLVRGTGLSGLHGISGVNKSVLRPLITTTKDEILAYAHENALHWREDRSNDSDDYKRNLIRHKVIPVLKQLNPSLESTFGHSADKLSSADHLLKELLDQWAATIVTKKNDQVRIEIAAFMEASEPAYRLWHLLEQFGFSYQQTAQIIASVAGIPGKQFFSKSHLLLIDRTDLIIKSRVSEEEIWGLEIRKADGHYHLGTMSLFFEQRERDSNPRTCYEKNSIIVGADKLQFPLLVRKWKPGDVFHPFGMKGKRKKLSDLFIDLKMDRFQKENTYVLLNGNEEIMWVIGVRSDERYRVAEGIEDIVSISYKRKFSPNYCQ